MGMRPGNWEKVEVQMTVNKTKDIFKRLLGTFYSKS